MIGRDEDCPSEDCPKVHPKDVIGQNEDGRSKDCPKVRLKDVIGRDEENCPYDDASDLSSCQTDLIGQERKLVISSGRLLIGWSDGLVFLKRF